MTKHVRRSFRTHRKASWGLALALVVGIAAVAIPIATAADKTYTLTATSPVCTGAAPQTTITLKNTSTSQTLGSAEIYFPANSVAGASLGTVRTNTTSTTSPPGNWDILALDNLALAPGASRAITVTFLPNVTFSRIVQAVVKQANKFNDTQGGANLFSLEGSFPTLRVVACVTIQGRVYQDRNLDNTFTIGTGAFLFSDVPKAWRVDLYAKEMGAASYPSTPYRTTTSSAADGSYTFTQVPTGSDYKICVVAAGADASSKWALQSPTGNTDCGPISAGGPAASAANILPSLSAEASGRDFQVVPVVGPFGANTDPSTVGGYTVDAGSNSTKPDTYYVQDTWVDDQGRTNFRFSPILPCGPPQDCTKKVYLLETLVADIELSDLGGQQVTLQYDDTPPFLDGDLKSMPYCNIDPRQSSGALATSGVLSGSDTSCIVGATQNVVAGGKVHAVYTVYTSYDGGRQIG